MIRHSSFVWFKQSDEFTQNLRYVSTVYLIYNENIRQVWILFRLFAHLSENTLLNGVFHTNDLALHIPYSLRFPPLYKVLVVHRLVERAESYPAFLFESVVLRHYLAAVIQLVKPLVANFHGDSGS